MLVATMIGPARARRWLLVVIAAGMLPAVLLAQDDRRREPRGRESRVTLGYSGNAPVEFNPQRCGSSVGMSFGAGFAREIAPRFWLGGRGDLHYANPFKRDTCFFGGTESPIPTGPFTLTREEVTRSVPQYQFLSVSALAAVEPIRLSLLRARAYAGIGAVAFKPVFPRFYGIEVLPGTQSRYALSVERWEVSLPFDSVTYNYSNGIIQRRTAIGFKKDRAPIVIRFSMVTGLGGRGRG